RVASDGSSAPGRVKATEELDRCVSSPRFSEDGKAIVVLVADDRSVYPVLWNVATNRVTRLFQPPVVVSSPAMAGTCAVALSGGDSKPTEVYKVDPLATGHRLTQLSHQNDAVFAELQLGTTEEVSAKSKDGTEVHGLLTRTGNYGAGSDCRVLADDLAGADPRFKAATRGAGSRFTVAFYGTDQYLTQYDYEIGPRWDAKAWETYQKISYPFLHADRIKTPTLFLGG